MQLKQACILHCWEIRWKSGQKQDLHITGAGLAASYSPLHQMGPCCVLFHTLSLYVQRGHPQSLLPSRTVIQRMMVVAELYFLFIYFLHWLVIW
jgi:hypothetical protein